jgi:hypothetical protein
MRAVAALAVLFCAEVLAAGAVAEDPEACAVEVLKKATAVQPRPTTLEPCDGLRIMLDAAAACTADRPADRGLQKRAAAILPLERNRRISISVLASLRQTLASPERQRESRADPEALRRQIGVAEANLEKIEAELGRERRAAQSAGYPQLANSGEAQKVIANAKWRYIETETKRQLGTCSDPAGQKAAAEFLAGIALAMSHGSALERETIRRILDGK